jgi:acetolactate synthase-1/2/3 large subunit
MGDASFGMTGMDIETASRNRIAILTSRLQQRRHGRRAARLGESHGKIRRADHRRKYTKVAEGLNVAALRVEKPADIAPAILEAVSVTSERPVPARIHRQGRLRIFAVSVIMRLC